MSLPYSVAVALVDGRALPEQYTDERVLGDSQLIRLSEVVSITSDETLSRGVSCRMIVELADGEIHETTVDYPRGSTQNPLTDSDLTDKARVLSAPVIGEKQFERLAKLVFDVDGLESMEPILELVTVRETES